MKINKENLRNDLTVFGEILGVLAFLFLFGYGLRFLFINGWLERFMFIVLILSFGTAFVLIVKIRYIIIEK